MRLPLDLFHRLLAHLGQAWPRHIDDSSLWLGHRVLLIDGSSTALADQPPLQRFGYPYGQRPGLGRPVAHLTDGDRYSAAELARLYGLRWEIEVYFRNLKTTMKMHELKCHTEDGMRKELAMYAIAYNLVRLKMLAECKGDESEAKRVSFIDAMRALGTALVRGYWTAVRLIRVPLREGRSEPREIVRRPKPYKLITKPRRERRLELLAQGVAANQP